MHLAVGSQEFEIRRLVAGLERLDVRRVAIDEARCVGGSLEGGKAGKSQQEGQESLHGDKGI